MAIAIQMPFNRISGRDSSPPTTAAMNGADERADEHGHVEAVGQLEDGEPTDRGERSLGERDVAAEAGHHRDRQEHDRQHDRLGDEEDPDGVAAGEQDHGARDEERGAEQTGDQDPPRVRHHVGLRRRWRVDAGERIARPLGLTNLRREHQDAEQHDERDRRGEVVLDRRQPGVVVAPLRDERVEERDQDAEPEPTEEGPRQADEIADRCCGDGDHDDVEELAGGERA